ncbi:MAG: AlpA family phage regulatory protein [Proteobacteria bacterium]|nr:AlpA family phage regulatory protein [Pseudomonadota bacterium]
MSKTFLRMAQVEERTGLSRWTIRRAVRDGTFPAPVRLSANSVGWLESELERWAARRVAERDDRAKAAAH